ncbi:oligosaccharide flippase family protein, partial [Bremerella sp. JC817]|uniref:oligosaccharide flippase family protein n=1 Tax=Bremerella sp. JC817 TaxID=3231756 RepID=UPI003458A829
EFRSQGLVNLLCAFVGAGIALGLALMGWGVWALVYAPIGMAVVRAMGLTIAARLLVWPVFDFRGARDIVTFGGALTICQLLWIVQSQSDIFIAGRTFSTRAGDCLGTVCRVERGGRMVFQNLDSSPPFSRFLHKIYPLSGSDQTAFSGPTMAPQWNQLGRHLPLPPMPISSPARHYKHWGSSV